MNDKRRHLNPDAYADLFRDRRHTPLLYVHKFQTEDLAGAIQFRPFRYHQKHHGERSPLRNDVADQSFSDAQPRVMDRPGAKPVRQKKLDDIACLRQIKLVNIRGYVGSNNLGDGVQSALRRPLLQPLGNATGSAVRTVRP